MNLCDLSFFELVGFFVKAILALGVAVLILAIIYGVFALLLLIVRTTWRFLLDELIEPKTFDEAEIRMQWKKAFIVFFVSSYVVGVIDILLRAPTVTNALPEILIYWPLGFSVFAWVTYYFVYEKKGTLLLGFNAMMGLFWGVAGFLKPFGKAIYGNGGNTIWSTELLLSCLLIYYSFNCFKLLNLNESYKQKPS